VKINDFSFVFIKKFTENGLEKQGKEYDFWNVIIFERVRLQTRLPKKL